MAHRQRPKGIALYHLENPEDTDQQIKYVLVFTLGYCDGKRSYHIPTTPQAEVLAHLCYASVKADLDDGLGQK
jgi:hypothetical protein